MVLLSDGEPSSGGTREKMRALLEVVVMVLVEALAGGIMEGGGVMVMEVAKEGRL